MQVELPELQTERLRLVIPLAAHAQHYREFFSDEDASSGYGGPPTPGQAWTRPAHDRGIWPYLLPAPDGRYPEAADLSWD